MEETEKKFKKVSLFNSTEETKEGDIFKNESFKNESFKDSSDVGTINEALVKDIKHKTMLSQKIESEKSKEKQEKNISPTSSSVDNIVIGEIGEKIGIKKNTKAFLHIKNVKNSFSNLAGSNINIFTLNKLICFLLILSMLVGSYFVFSKNQHNAFIPDSILYTLQDKNVVGYQNVFDLKSQYYMNMDEISTIKDKDDFINFSKKFVSNVFSINAITKNTLDKTKVQRKVDIIEDNIKISKTTGKVIVDIPYIVTINEKTLFQDGGINEKREMLARITYLIVKKDGNISIYIDSVSNDPVKH